MHPENDTGRAEFTVIRHDVGVQRLVWPVGVVDSGATGQPQAVVKNYGTEIESFEALFRIGNSYVGTVEVIGLGSGDSAEVRFAEWQALVRGGSAVCCSTMLDGDRVEANNIGRESVFIRVRDIGAAEIVRPVEVIGRGQVQPEALIRNYGNRRESACCWFEILDSSNARVYVDSVALELEPESLADTVVFASWEVRGGTFTDRCWTVLAGDMRPENDTVASEFRVPRIDAALERILFPVDTIPEGWVQPVVQVANLGEEPADIHVLLAVKDSSSGSAPLSDLVFQDSVWVYGLGETCRVNVLFRQWFAQPGQYQVSARTVLVGDEIGGNDSASAAVLVESLFSRHWMEMAPLPEGPRGMGVRSGGCLVATDQFIYALKGGASDEFYRFDVGNNSWQTLAPMPLGTSGRKVKGGAALCWDGGNRLFAVKGNRTREFWIYNIATDSWEMAPSLPEFTSPIRYGSGLAFVPSRDTDKVYLVKGSNTLDFLVYWGQQRQWHARRSLPVGEGGRRAGRGTCLTEVQGRPFCLRGATNQLHEYLPERDSWVVRARLPYCGPIGGRRRCKEGAAIVQAGTQSLYAVKGGGCNEFWRYDVAADSWTQLEPVPMGRQRRRVKSGGALACSGDTAYLLKGGGTFEFWRYVPQPARTFSAKSEIRSQKSEIGDSRRPLRMGVSGHPPLVPWATRSLGHFVLFDASGRFVSSSDHWGSSSLRPGVYFLVVQSDSMPILRKVVVIR